MCDIHCMFIGDCCYDYLVECDKREFDMNGALTIQSKFYQHFKQYSYCKYNHFEDNDKTFDSDSLQIVSCPAGDEELSELCGGNNGSRTFSSYIPVIARGILFSNVYCAACHGIRLQEVEILTTTYNIKCTEHAEIEAQLLPFQHTFRCIKPSLALDKKPQYLQRFEKPCLCSTSTSVYSNCTNTKYKDECHAYTAVIHYGTHKVLFPGSRQF